MKYIILAGGNGTRLFPLSREKLPKQFLKLFSNKSLIQETVLRLKNDNFLIVSSKNTFYKLKSQLEEISLYSEEKILLEPYGKNTAPAILYALTKIKDEEIVAVLPSDHFIKNNEKFLACLRKAENLAKKGYIVTIGIVPNYPETGYGYLELENEIEKEEFKVKRFVEKPDKYTAKKYLENGNYLWNAGMFVFEKKVFIEETKKISSSLYKFYEKITNNPDRANNIYKEVEKISVDYAIMEKSTKIASVKGNFGWNDIGSFKSLANILKDMQGKENIGQSNKIININSNNNLIFSDKPIISLIDIKNTAIIDTKDILLISSLQNSQKVKKVYETLNNEKNPVTVAHPDEERPWGKFESILTEKGIKVKRIVVKAGEKLSLQYHNKREEHWIITRGKAIMTLGNRNFEVKKGDYIHIDIKELHTIEGITETEFIEVQMGDYLGEDDIVRVEDKYGREENE